MIKFPSLSVDSCAIPRNKIHLVRKDLQRIRHSIFTATDEVTSLPTTTTTTSATTSTSTSGNQMTDTLSLMRKLY